jgi:peptidoglycan hydrolase CwlO-like protein
MMRHVRLTIATVVCCLLFIAWQVTQLDQFSITAAEECTCPSNQEELLCNKTKQACWQSKIDDKQKQANTLSNVISVLNSKINVQELQIKQTKLEIAKLVDEIQDLSVRISGLNVSLDRLTEVLLQRISANYKRPRVNPFTILLTSNSVSNFFGKYKYMQIAQRHTTQLMKQAETQKLTYDQEKALKEKKQEEVNQKRILLQSQEKELTSQRADQQTLLKQTKNDEARYQEELAKTIAEEKALQGIVAGQGSETKVGDVKQGDSIASIINGSSTCSNGTHLHFEVVKDGSHQNPAGYLKSLDGIIWSNSPDGAFDFTGGWDWPINNPARINQGYGMTWYARVRRAYGGAPHTGIDMISKNGGDYGVKAVKDGILYRGSIHCGKGLLRYVKVQHKDSNLSSYYLHVNY